MARPKITRKVSTPPVVDYFKPRGIPLRELEEVLLAVEELEALRLADLEGLNQVDAADNMGVSRATFARILRGARGKVADALVCGKAVLIEGGEFELVSRKFFCRSCKKTWTESFGTGRPKACPACARANITRSDNGNRTQETSPERDE